MGDRIMKLSVVGLIICAVCAGCSRSVTNSAQREEDNSGTEHWAPTAEAIASAKQEKEAPPIIVPTPRANDYDLNPRGAMQAEESSEEAVESDPALGGLEKLPPPQTLPKLSSGDEADQFGLPEWERMARGELHVKRIRY